MVMINKQAIGAELRRLRARSGKTQRDIAPDVGVSYQYLSAVELGKENPTLDTLERFATAVGGSVEIRIIPPDAVHLSQSDSNFIDTIAELPLHLVPIETKNAILLMLKSLSQDRPSQTAAS